MTITKKDDILYIVTQSKCTEYFMPSQIRLLLDNANYPVGSKIEPEFLLGITDFKPQLEGYYPETPDEYLTGKNFIQGEIKDRGDWSKQITIFQGDLTNYDISYENIELFSPSASIGLCQIEDGNFVLIFKNKAKIVGWALPGGTVAQINPECGPLTQEERAKAFRDALIREFKEECGITLTDTLFIEAPQINARLKHNCAFYLCKGVRDGDQRIEDMDLSVLLCDLETAIKALNSYLAVDDFIIKLLNTYRQQIAEYFNVELK
ncbi:MAG: NUDIX hydrolase [Patescibacteria group bacterium]